MSRSQDWSIPNAFTTKPQRRIATATVAGARRCLQAIGRLLVACYERERQRRELSAMRRSDFGDLPLSMGVVRDEVRRWPWQKTTLH
jgi:hypothetical protein